MAKQATYGNYVVTIEDNGSVNVTKNGALCDNTAAALRDIAKELNFELDPKWLTRQLGAKIYKAILEGAPAPKAETKAAKESKPAPAPKAEKSTDSNEAALKARIAELEEELAKQKKAAAEPTPAKKESSKKSNDPFDGLMVKVCAGMYNQKYGYSEHKYTEGGYYHPDGDGRKKEVWRNPTSDWTFKAVYKRLVTISKPFNICKYPVTQGQWKQIMGEGFNPSNFRGDDNLPVESVSVEEIFQFIDKLNKLTGKKYRLPTEAEWQWAAVGAAKDDDQGDWAGCSKEEDLDQYAWFDKNSDNKTHPVSQKKPNELGLYDMCGNVWEVCADKIDSLNNKSGNQHPLFRSDSVTDPCEIEGDRYILKGGAFDKEAQSTEWYISCAVYAYGFTSEKGRSFRIGFRLAETIE